VRGRVALAGVLAAACALALVPRAVEAAENPSYEAYFQGRYLTALKLAEGEAEKGSKEAFTLMGEIYSEGLGVAQDFKKAADAYAKGADLGDANAQLSLGLMVAEGVGVKKDLRIAADLFGLPENVGRSKHLSALAPFDVKVSLVASREGEATSASIKLGGKAGASDVSLVARALGNPAKPGEANIAIDGSVTGERPQAILVLLFPDLPVERLAAAGQNSGKLTVKLSGVPNSKVIGKAALETGSMGVAFAGQGSLQPGGFAFTGKGAMVSHDASQALTLIGFEAPPSAGGVPLKLRFELVKQGPAVDLKSITGAIAGEDVTGSAHFELGGAKTRFALSGSADTISLPSLLGVLVAWHRTPSTEEMLSSIGSGVSEFWPSRGFSLGPVENSEGSITLKANTLTLGSTLKVQGATLAASVGKDGLSIADLTGRLFGGEFAASGTLSPRGNGAELTARADLKGGKLEDFAAGVTGSSLAKGPFDLAFTVQGEGLSPPGLVAGLSGQGTFSLGAGALQALSPDPLRRVAAAAAKPKTARTPRKPLEELGDQPDVYQPPSRETTSTISYLASPAPELTKPAPVQMPGDVPAEHAALPAAEPVPSFSEPAVNSSPLPAATSGPAPLYPVAQP